MSLWNRAWLALFSCSLLSLQAALAAEAALVQLIPPAQLSATAGEGVAFSVVLLARGQFSGPTYLDLPVLDGAIIMQVSERPLLDTQQVGEETYVSASYDFSVYPQRAGRLVVAPVTARFASRERYDQPVIAHRLQTRPFEVTVVAPDGAVTGELVVSARELSATEAWSPEPVSARVGDAFTRTLTVRARDVPAMLLPAPDFSDVEGVALYRLAPQLKDRTERGILASERIDTATYVCERAGSFRIPELSLRWWDPGQARWQTRRFPEVTLEVAENPARASPPRSAHGHLASRGRAGMLLWTVAVVAGILLARKRLTRAWQAWRQRRAATETAQWGRLRKACGRGDAASIYRELEQWLAHLAMTTPQLTVGRSDLVSDRLRAASIGLQQRLAGIDADWDARVLAGELAGLRRRLRGSPATASAPPLPPLNPESSGAARNWQAVVQMPD